MEKEHIPATVVGAIAGAILHGVGFAIFRDATPPFGQLFVGAVTGALLVWMYRTY